MNYEPGPVTKAARIFRNAGLSCDEATELAFLCREIAQKPGGVEFLKNLIRDSVKPEDRHKLTF